MLNYMLIGGGGYVLYDWQNPKILDIPYSNKYSGEYGTITCTSSYNNVYNPARLFRVDETDGSWFSSNERVNTHIYWVLPFSVRIVSGYVLSRKTYSSTFQFPFISLYTSLDESNCILLKTAITCSDLAKTEFFISKADQTWSNIIHILLYANTKSVEYNSCGALSLFGQTKHMQL